MKRILFYIFFIFFTGQFLGCVFLDKDVLCRIWMYGDEMKAPDFDSLQLNPVSFISFYSNGTYTSDFGTFEYGRWKASNSRIELTNYKNKTKAYGIKFIWPNSLKIIAEDGFIVGFEGQPSMFSSPGKDPYCLQNNQWRLAATHKESEKEIKSRLVNHCHFWQIYFTWALKNKIDYVDVRSTPTLLKIYGNGFVLRTFENLPDEWKAYFFDEADCKKANEMMEDVLVMHKIKIEKTDDKYKMFISMFKQAQQALQ